MILLSAKTNEHAGFFVDTACTIHNLSFVRNSPVFSQTRMVLADVQARGHGTFASMTNTSGWTDEQYCVKCGHWYIADELIDDNGKCPSCKRTIRQATDRARLLLDGLLFAYNTMLSEYDPDETPDSLVYFIRGKTTRRIKIGYTSTNVWNRLTSSQTGSPDVLEVIGVISAPQWFEKELHSILEPFRSHGEWFDNSRVLMDFIKRVAKKPKRKQ